MFDLFYFQHLHLSVCLSLMYNSLYHCWISLHTTSPFNLCFLSDFSLLQSHRPYCFNLFARGFLFFQLSITFAGSGLGSETDFFFLFFFYLPPLQLGLLKYRDGENIICYVTCQIPYLCEELHRIALQGLFQVKNKDLVADCFQILFQNYFKTMECPCI